MNFPLKYQLKDGTEVEVSQMKTFQKFIFDFSKNQILFDSYTWAPATTAEKEKEQGQASFNREPRQREALEIFWGMQ